MHTAYPGRLLAMARAIGLVLACGNVMIKPKKRTETKSINDSFILRNMPAEINEGYSRCKPKMINSPAEAKPATASSRFDAVRDFLKLLKIQMASDTAAAQLARRSSR